jgi:Family of unknown function (DUF6221)
VTDDYRQPPRSHTPASQPTPGSVAEVIAFIRDRLTEDEQAARAAAAEPDMPQWSEAGLPIEWAAHNAARLGHDAAEAHIMRWLPARVLADVEATRRLVDRCECCLAQRPYGTDAMALASQAYVTLRDIAARWQHHPDYAFARWHHAPFLP